MEKIISAEIITDLNSLLNEGNLSKNRMVSRLNELGLETGANFLKEDLEEMCLKVRLAVKTLVWKIEDEISILDLSDEDINGQLLLDKVNKSGLRFLTDEEKAEIRQRCANEI